MAAVVVSYEYLKLYKSLSLLFQPIVFGMHLIERIFSLHTLTIDGKQQQQRNHNCTSSAVAVVKEYVPDCIPFQFED